MEVSIERTTSAGRVMGSEDMFTLTTVILLSSLGSREHQRVSPLSRTYFRLTNSWTLAIWDGDGTTTNDKENDNLFASCCCAQQGPWGWRQVCNCATSLFTCNNTCVITALRNESRYYAAARHVYSDVTLLYPKSNIWIVGHSLGGTVGSLIGLTYGLPVVTFQAVPDALAVSRLGLPEPPGSHPGISQTRLMTGSYHIGHTADPVYMGSCNGMFSPCTIAGYSFESQCHTGQRCVYDVVVDKGWRVDLRRHSLRTVIDDIIKDYDTVPACKAEPECRDCYNWNYFEGNNSSLPTTSQSTKSSISTTCRTPGWWGCLDKTTTTSRTVPPSSTASTTSTTTCKTPGWFGCNDKTTEPVSLRMLVVAPTQTYSPTSSR
jgi:lipase ATG15